MTAAALKVNKSKFLCIECFETCTDATNYVIHKESHLCNELYDKAVFTYFKKPCRPSPMCMEWMEIRAEMIYDAETHYYPANLQPVGLLYNGPEKDQCIQIIKKMLQKRSPRKSTLKCIGMSLSGSEDDYKSIPVFNRTF